MTCRNTFDRNSAKNRARYSAGAGALLACAAILALLAGCAKSTGGKDDETPAAPKTVVYAAGVYRDGSGDEPCYWRDGVRGSLSVMSGTSTGGAKAITASGGTIYIAGYSDMYHSTACYWAGGTRFDQAYFSEGAVGICVDGGTVYTIVNNPYLNGPGDTSTNSGMYYANQTKANNLFGIKTQVNGIASRGGVICAVGQNAVSRAAYWSDLGKAGIVETELNSNASNAFAVCPSGNVNYIAGSVGTDSSEKPCYWIQTNGLPRTDLDIGTNYGEALAIKVAGNVVYTAGWYNDGSGSGDIPCLWKGTTRIDLPKAQYDSHATGIDVLDGKAYVSGWYSVYDASINGLKSIPCYWTVVAGVAARVDLPGGTNGYANGIVVVEE